MIQLIIAEDEDFNVSERLKKRHYKKQSQGTPFKFPLPSRSPPERVLPGLQAGPAARRRHRHRERGDARRLPPGLHRRRAAPPGLRRDGAHHGHGARDHGGK